MGAVVELIGVDRVYPVLGRRRALRALSDVTLTIEEGEILGILGPNGSGKSTLLKIVVGLVRPTAGDVRVFGGAADSMASRRAVGFLPDSPSFPRHLSAQELLKFYARLYGLNDRASRLRIAEVLAETGLIHAADRRIGGYSKGMLQRLGFAQAILHDPQLLVLDEPGNGLDPEGIDFVATMLDQARVRGRTVLVASHLISQMEDACDRIAIMVGGRLSHLESLGELRRGQARCAAYAEDGWCSSTRGLIAGPSGCDEGLAHTGCRRASGAGLLTVYRSVVGSAHGERPGA